MLELFSGESLSNFKMCSNCGVFDKKVDKLVQAHAQHNDYGNGHQYIMLIIHTVHHMVIIVAKAIYDAVAFS